ncbi:MAG: hypothetical protein RIQ56_1007, partial [Candidatus Parcubacteria bacterium]
DDRLNFFLGDIRDPARLRRAFNHVDIVIHAAALKQVPALEYNPSEAIDTNITGTKNVIDAALDRDVGKVLVVSSDKAVQPVNLYGATKLCAERLAVAANAYRGKHGMTKISVVRYGNVIGSRGSLVELIEKRRSTGVLPLTDKRMTRFWIHIEEIMKIVINILDIMEGGEIFIPKMESLLVEDVMTELAPDCKIEVIGIRPGEKLHELLITEHEARRTKDAGEVYVVLPEFRTWPSKEPYKLKKTFDDSSLYVSDNPRFLRSRKDVKRMLKK